MDADEEEGELKAASRVAIATLVEPGHSREGSGRTGRATPCRAWRWPKRPLGRSLAAMLDEERRYGHGFLWLPVFMGAGAVAELAAPHDIPAVAILPPLAVLFLLAIVGHNRGRGWAATAFFTAAFFAGMAAGLLQIERVAAPVLDGEVVTHVRGVVTDRERDDRGYWRYTIRILGTADPVIRRPPETARILARSKHVPVRIGERIGGLARLSPPSGPALPGEYDFAFNSFFGGLGAIGFFYGPPKRLDGPEFHGGFFFALHRWLADLRETIDGRIRKVLPGDEGALAAALIVSDRRAIPDPVVVALRAAGLAHILSISGLHLALVAGTLFLLLRSGLGLFPRLAEAVPIKKIAALAALAVSTGYLALSGAEVATVRSWVMLAIMLVAVVLDRPAITLRNVAIAALVIVLVNPASVVGPSFQMSFAATAALVAGFAALARYRRSIRAEGGQRSGLTDHAVKFVAAVCFTSLLAGSATWIFAAYHFHRIALYGLLGNLLAEPIISLVVMPMGLVSTLLMPYGLEAWPLTLMGAGLRAVIAIARAVESLGGVVGTSRIPAGVLVVFVAGFLILVLMRSKLRLAGVPLMLVALLLTRPAFAPPRPDILISEDGGMVGLPAKTGIATNRKRPPSFIFHQWLGALDSEKAIAPNMIAPVGVRPPVRRGQKRPPPTLPQVGAFRAVLNGPAAGRFTCVKKMWCAVNFDGRLKIATISDLGFLGPACDLADIVVTSAAIRLERCRSGAMLFTGRTLRRSGSIAIYVEPRRGGASADLPAASPVRINVVTALGDVVRPWTVQRYYDWRSRSFDFSKTVPRASLSVIAAD